MIGLWTKRVLGILIVIAIAAAIWITVHQGYYHGKYGIVVYRISSPVGFWIEVCIWGGLDLFILKKVVELFKRGKNV
jgi:hypothetical protein